MKNLKGLILISVTNMLERFSFYMLMSYLLIHLMESKGLTSVGAGNIYSFFYYTIYSAIFALSIIGDFINRKKVILIGLLVMAIGYLTYPVLLSSDGFSFIIPLGFLSLGIGVYKANMQVKLGDLFRENIKEGALGYIFFYAFINLGAVLAPAVAIWLRDNFGYNSVYILSGVVVLIALCLYYFIPTIPKTTDQTVQTEKKTLGNIMFGAPDADYSVQQFTNKKYGADKIIGLIFLILIVPVFWLAYQQNGLVYAMYVSDYTEIGTATDPIVMSLNPIMVVIFSVIVFTFIFFFGKIKRIHSILPIIAAGMLIAAIGYCIPVLGLKYNSEVLSLKFAYAPLIFISAGEILIQPFLMLGIYHYSPPKLKGLFMGIFTGITTVGTSLLFLYAIVYEDSGPIATFKRMSIHILICAVSFILVWLLLRKLSIAKRDKIVNS